MEFDNTSVSDRGEERRKIELKISELEELVEESDSPHICELGCLYLKRSYFRDNLNAVEDYKKGLAFITSSLENAYFNEDKKAILFYSYDGLALTNDYRRKLKSKNIKGLEESDLENLISGIICTELSEMFGNQENESYQGIGRNYYSLQHYIEKGDLSMLENVIKKTLSYEYFVNYRGKLIEVRDNLADKSKSSTKLRMEIQSLALKYALDNFKKGNEIEDDSADNMSYRGMCIVDLIRFDRQLKKFGKLESGGMLKEARLLLKSALEKKLKDKSKKREIYKDYSRIAECESYLAVYVEEAKEKRDLLTSSISHLGSAVQELTCNNMHINPEIYCCLGNNYFKLGEFGKAIGYFSKAKDAGDKSSELLSKMGLSYIELLDKYIDNNKINRIIKKAKDILEEAILKNKIENGYYVYPYFSLHRLAKKVLSLGMSLDDYSLRCPTEYCKEALEPYSENNPYWSVKQVGKMSKNCIFEPTDNYGLLKDIILLKRGKSGDLERELEIGKDIKRKLVEKFGTERRFFVPSPLDVVEHKDKNEEFSGVYYIIMREDGNILEDIINDTEIKKQKKLYIVEDVINYLAFIHTSLEPIKIGFGYENFIEERLNKVGIESSIIKKIVDNYAPIKKDLEQGIFVFYKDAHARNWLVREVRENNEYRRHIIGLDWEEKGSSPIEIDLCNLIEWIELTYQEKEELIRSYNQFYYKYSENKLKEAASLRRFLNASVPRAIQSLRWPITNSKKVTILKKSIESIAQIKFLDKDCYDSFYKNYEGLKEGIIDLVNFFQK